MYSLGQTTISTREIETDMERRRYKKGVAPRSPTYSPAYSPTVISPAYSAYIDP